MPNAQQTLAGGLHGKTGSYYVTDLDDKSRTEAHAFSTVAAASSVVAGLNTVAQVALGGASSQVFGRRVMWSADTCAMLGQNVSRRAVLDAVGMRTVLIPATGSNAGKYAAGLLTRMKALFGDDGGGFIRYGLLIPDGLMPDTITGASGLLFAGSDFAVYPGMLVTFMDPALEFPDGWITVVSGTEAAPVPAAYPVGAIGGGSVSRRMFYARSGQSVWALEKAAAEAAGLFVCRGVDVITEVRPAEVGAVYFWASGSYDEVYYTHSLLPLGTQVEDGTIISSFSGGALSHPGFSIIDCRLATSFNGLSWDISMLRPSAPLLMHDASNYDEVAAQILAMYRGRLLMVRPGAAVLADPARLAALNAFLRRHRPVGAMAIVEHRPI